MPENSGNPASDRFSGVALAVASMLSVLAMAHHPSSFGTGLGGWVHAIMMVVVLVNFAGFIQFAGRWGLGRFSVRAGVVFYGAAVLANLLAALINGFVVEAAHANGANADVLRLCWELNQALAYGGVFATSISFAIWGVDLIVTQRRRRILGAAALTAGLVPAALLWSGVMDMHVAGAFVVYAIQAAFGVLAGAELMRARPQD
ncbi:MAG: hypothetical protein IV086_13320 [Hyphomonadaceae bacterium]|nr:hypothetical protein [Hyphomonadaceae bacterium]